MTAVTVENLGEAWCEVPVTVRSAQGENWLRRSGAGQEQSHGARAFRNRSKRSRGERWQRPQSLNAGDNVDSSDGHALAGALNF